MKQRSHTRARAAELVEHFDALARRFTLLREGVSRATPLSRQDMRVITAIGARPDGSAGELAAHLMVGMSTLTSILDRLAVRRLVARSRSESDRRVVRVRLTPEGRRECGRIRRRRFRKAGYMLGALAPTEQTTFLALMRKIARAAREDARPPLGRRRPGRSGRSLSA